MRLSSGAKRRIPAVRFEFNDLRTTAGILRFAQDDKVRHLVRLVCAPPQLFHADQHPS
ncbi:hypothetical protein SBA2_30089 [Acidobacteriia bacterium SbA2]|nr:hypothetical protein SBA2_30089 [Acidobacteriia bacterium SbA2]